jgi:DNA-binding response OmpR family regulator
MIVDDDVAITELMKTLLEMEGHEPTIVNDSMLAFEIASSVEPDLITLDLMMPGLTGYELCKILIEDPKFLNTPIVIISAKDDPESKRKALEAGARDYIIKPFNIDNFIAMIDTLVRAGT